jgi:hypothetical protein
MEFCFAAKCCERICDLYPLLGQFFALIYGDSLQLLPAQLRYDLDPYLCADDNFYTYLPHFLFHQIVSFTLTPFLVEAGALLDVGYGILPQFLSGLGLLHVKGPVQLFLVRCNPLSWAAS